MTSDFILEPECKQLSRLSNTSRWRLEKQGKFPKRFKIGDPDAQNGRVAWSRAEIEAWRVERMAARRAVGKLQVTAA
jgi:predicted DNA-binding transcriptional regulator AlpA